MLVVSCNSAQQVEELPPTVTPTIGVVATATSTTIPATATVAPIQEEPTATASLESVSDRRVLLNNLVETQILPLHRQLLSETESLQQLVAKFAEQPTVETLSAAQAQWRKSAEAWARIEPFDLRPVMFAVSQIKKWPVNTEALEQYIADEEVIDEYVVVALGATEKGLTAIEYFLFGHNLSIDESLAKLTTQPKRMTYLVALSQNLPKATAELLMLWSAGGDDQTQKFINADFTPNNVQGSISMVANVMIALVEAIVKTKLDYPLHGILADPQPDAVESPYADHSTALIIANLRTIQQIFDAGLGDYLDKLDVTARDIPLSAAIDAKIEESIIALEAIDQPLRAAILKNPKSVQAARDQVRALLVLLKVDMANQLGITVTFSDNDGD